jgi:hypothetical protein
MHKGKTYIQENIPLPFSQESCAALNIKFNFPYLMIFNMITIQESKQG